MITINAYTGLMTFAAMLGFIGNSYAFYARNQGWPVGKAFSPDRPATWTNASIALVPVSFGLLWYDFGFLPALAFIVAAFVAAWIATLALRHYVQVLWVVGMLALMGLIAWKAIGRLM